MFDLFENVFEKVFGINLSVQLSLTSNAGCLLFHSSHILRWKTEKKAISFK